MMEKPVTLFVAAAAILALPMAALAGPMELQAPDGRTVVLYDDFTWEYKRAAPSLSEDTVNLDDLVAKPSKYRDREVVVTGALVRLLGAYRLQSGSGQNNIVVDVGKVRRADQIKLEKAVEKFSVVGSVRVRIKGKVERDLMTYRLVASDLLLSE